MRISIPVLLCLSLALAACDKAPQNTAPVPAVATAPATASIVAPAASTVVHASTAPAAVSAAAPGTSAAASQATSLAPDAATTAGPEVAGSVALAQGSVTDTAKDGSSRALKDGDSVYPGDSFVLGPDSYLDLDLEDTGRILLRPNTTFQIASYHYEADAHAANGPTDANGQPLIKPQQPENAFFKLVKGGLRAIDGVIGKSEPQNYGVETPVATIGVRGTAFDARYCGDDCTDEADTSGAPQNGLYTSVSEGSIGVKNDGGETVQPAGKSGYVKSRKERAQALATPPKALRHMDLPDKLKPRAQKNRDQIHQKRQQRRQAILQHRREQAVKSKAGGAAAKPAGKAKPEMPAERRQQHQEEKRGGQQPADKATRQQQREQRRQQREQKQDAAPGAGKSAAAVQAPAQGQELTPRERKQQQRQERQQQREQKSQEQPAPAQPAAKPAAKGDTDKCKDKKKRRKDKDKCGGD
jgi:hypothetical protein